MLYVTTRDDLTTYTAYHALHEDRGPDGGFFMPFRCPILDRTQLAELMRHSPAGAMAAILNLFFPARLEAADVAACLEGPLARISVMSHRLMVTELWQGTDGTFDQPLQRLARRICPEPEHAGEVSRWTRIAIRIAALFGVFNQLYGKKLAGDDRNVDITVVSGDFSMPFAAWYAREMGLPIKNIICACNDNSAVWDLFYHGELHTDAVAKKTDTPEADVGVPVELERLIYSALGSAEALRFSEVCRKGRLYQLPEEELTCLRQGLHAAVIGQARSRTIIRNVYHTNDYLLDPYSALAYGGLQDYRAGSGESRDAVLWAEKSALSAASQVAEALGISVVELRDRVG